jgi:hypothetical protein
MPWFFGHDWIPVKMMQFSTFCAWLDTVKMMQFSIFDYIVLFDYMK